LAPASRVADPPLPQLDLSLLPCPAADFSLANVLRRVEAGEEIEVLRDNRPVAKIVPLSRRRQWLPAAEIGYELVRLGPDLTGLAEELQATLTDTTDGLPW
jgi:prevent-host-death family protein